MPTTTSDITTEYAEKYLRQLCKHFSHKVPAEEDGTTAKVQFPFALCHMEAGDGSLRIRCETDSQDDTERVHSVIEVHLVRFAFRETLQIAWKPL